ncbi:MAG: hypothetical protein JWM18_3586 [Chloroflexi bacterium]|jgi:hypothetical protein|nr:hypothetical protein [Chloroflexota bacterium]
MNESWPALRQRLLEDGGLPTAWRRRIEHAPGAHLAILDTGVIDDILA